MAPQLNILGVGTPDEAAEPKPGPGRHPGRLSAGMTELARTGIHGYRSGSEARQAVLTAAVGAGWQLHNIARHLETGAWPGLASFDTRYSPRNRRAALGRDWRKASAYIARAKPVHNCDTSRPPSHREPRGTAVRHLACRTLGS